MMDMVEKVARAILAKVDDLGIELESPFDPKLYPELAASTLARAAIEAMRRPTSAMKEAGANRLPDRSIDFAHDVYDTMINEALKAQQND